MFKSMLNKLGAEFGFIKEELGAMAPVEKTGIEQDVTNRLDKSKKLDEIDTITFGLETDDGKIVKVYVKTDDADEFEKALAVKLGDVDDIEQALNDLSKDYEIVDVEWPGKDDGKDKDEDENEDEEDGSDSLDSKVFNKKQEKREMDAKNENLNFGELATLKILDESTLATTIESRFTTSYQLMIYHAIVELGVPEIALARSPYRAQIIKGVREKAMEMSRSATMKNALRIFINRSIDYEAKAEEHEKAESKHERRDKISDVKGKEDERKKKVKEALNEEAAGEKWEFERDKDSVKIAHGEIAISIDGEQVEKLIKGIGNKELTIVKDQEDPKKKVSFSPRGSQVSVKQVGTAQSYMMTVSQIDKMLDALSKATEEEPVDDDEEELEKDEKSPPEEKVADKDDEDKAEVKEAKVINPSGYQYKKFTLLSKTKKGHTVVGATTHPIKGKGCNILKHKNGKYFAAGGSSTGEKHDTKFYDTPEDAATSYHTPKK